MEQQEAEGNPLAFLLLCLPLSSRTLHVLQHISFPQSSGELIKYVKRFV